MADRKMSLNELSDRVGISNVNMSRIKTGKIKAIRFSTLEMICETLECQPGDILEFAPRVKPGTVAVTDDAGPGETLEPEPRESGAPPKGAKPISGSSGKA